MNVSEQGTKSKKICHQTIPRTLIFLTTGDPARGEQKVLLLKGSPTKRLWANRYNGLGGHIEAHEDIHSAALREVAEESGLRISKLDLRAVIHIETSHDDTGPPKPGIIIFTFRGHLSEQEYAEQIPSTSAEGTPEWISVDQLANYPLVDDLYELIPRVLTAGPLAGIPIIYGHYSPLADGTMHYRFGGTNHIPTTKE